MRPVVVTVGPLAAASANLIAASQTLGAAGPLALTSVPVTLDTARRVGITSAGNDSGITFTITGTDRQKRTISETLAGANAGAAQSALDYLTVSSISASGATAGAVQAGTTTTASTALVRLDEYASPPLGGQVVTTGAPTWLVEGSFDDPNSPTNPVAPALMSWFPITDSTGGPVIKAEAAPLFVRLTQTAGLGSARATFVQYAETSQIQP